MKASVFKWGVNLWPPLFFSGIKVTYLAQDYQELRVTLKLRWYNRNYVGTHFGGSLYSMTDPFYMLMLMNNLGRDYIVWDKSATIDFLRPGKGRVFAEFELTQAMIDEVKAATAGGEKYLPTWEVTVRDDAGEAVARVEKVLYVRRKAGEKQS